VKSAEELADTENLAGGKPITFTHNNAHFAYKETKWRTNATTSTIKPGRTDLAYTILSLGDL
jgi:hypothetical protein